MKINISTEVRHCVKPMLCGGLVCVVTASVLPLYQTLLRHCSNMGIAVVVENSGGYAKMAHNGDGWRSCRLKST